MASTTERCPSCNGPMVRKICQTNKNGNRGKTYVTCYRRNAQGGPCKTFAWVDSVPNNEASNPSIPANVPIVGASIASSSNATENARRCCKENCRKVNIAKDCQRQQCKKHCIASGGCTYRSHTPQGGPLDLSDCFNSLTLSPTSEEDSHSVEPEPGSREATPRVAPNPPVTLTRHWPLDYYVIDIAAYFEACDRTNKQYKRTFEDHFPQSRYDYRTVVSLRNIWIYASKTLRKRFLGAGRTEAGKWRYFEQQARLDPRV